jgi:hypothetical protein
MAFVVETGTGSSTANSYADLPEALTYHADRGNAAWASALDPARTIALIQATAYLDAVYGQRCAGHPMVWTQALAWPRSYAWDQYGRPLYGIVLALKQATFEAALLALAGDLLPPGERAAQLVRRKVGNVEEDYRGGSSVSIYQRIDQLMKPLLGPAKVTR